MVTIAAPYSIWVLKQASDKLPLLLAWNEYLYAFLLLSRDTDITLGVAGFEKRNTKGTKDTKGLNNGGELQAAGGMPSSNGILRVFVFFVVHDLDLR